MIVKLTFLYRYFGGSLELISMDGYGASMLYFCYYTPVSDHHVGTDVYLRLPRLVSNHLHAMRRNLLTMCPRARTWKGLRFDMS